MNFIEFMRPITKLFFLLSVLVFLSALTGKSFACSGVFPDTPFCRMFAYADAVYKAKLKKVSSINGDYQKLTFDVEQTYKGEKRYIFDALNLIRARTSCDVLIEINKGETWIILAKYNEKEKSLIVNDDSFEYRFKSKNDAFYYKEAYDYLEKASRGKLQTEIHGQVKADNYIYGWDDPAQGLKVEGFKVTAEQNGSQLTTYTDVVGEFSFSGLTSGTYKVKVFFPFEIFAYGNNNFGDYKEVKSNFDVTERLYFQEFDITTKANECVFQYFVIRKTSD